MFVYEFIIKMFVTFVVAGVKIICYCVSAIMQLMYHGVKLTVQAYRTRNEKREAEVKNDELVDAIATKVMESLKTKS